MSAGFDSYQVYMKQIILKLKNLSKVQTIQILHQGNNMLIDTIEQVLERAIDNAYQEINSKDLVAIISQMVADETCYSYQY